MSEHVLDFDMDDFARRYHWVLDEHGEPKHVDSIREFWEWWTEHFGEHRVAHDEAGGVRVSTIFLSIDVSGEGRVFETMVFGEGGAALAQQRYHTRAEALAGHARHVREYLPCPPTD